MLRNVFSSGLLGSITQSIFGKSAKSQTDPEIVEILTGILDAQVDASEMQRAARENAGPSVVLSPVVPVTKGHTNSWFGGAPRLPENQPWPEIKGTPLCFVAQIDLKQLPQNIWSGVGPRSGHLAFFVHPHELAARVLHVEGDLVPREGPSPMESSFVMRAGTSGEQMEAYWPEWPITVSGNVGELPNPPVLQSDKRRNPARPFTNDVLDLTNPAHHPFNSVTLGILIDASRKALESRLSSISFFLKEKKLKACVRSALVDLQAEVKQSFERFEKITEEMAPFRIAFDNAGILPHLAALNDLSIGRVYYRGNDDSGFSEIEVGSANLTDARQADFCLWTEDYLRSLCQHARYVYLEAPQKLSTEALSLFEEVWQAAASQEFGGMSHPPKGFIYTPYGSNSPNEILLEIPTSYLIGWIWGDTYSIVLTIARDDLARANFDNVTADITN